MSEWYNEPQEGFTPTEPSANDTPPVPASSPMGNAYAQPTVSSVAGDEDDTVHTSESPSVEPPVPPSAMNTPPTPPYQPPYGAPPMPPPSYTSYGTQARPPYTSYEPPIPPKKKSSVNVALAVLAVLCCVSLIVCGVLAVMLISGDGNSVSGGSSVSSGASSQDNSDKTVNNDGPTLQISDVDDVDDGGLATSEIVSKNLDATVVLTMYAYETSSIYGYYYGFGAESSDSLTQVGSASGIIMSEDGYIITNSHCVYDEDSKAEYARIDVTLYDGRVYEGAEVVGYDPTTDLAVIKIEETDLQAAEFGDSSALSLGDRVVTIGNSGGLQWSVSQGVLSGLARDVYEDTGYAIKCLQVDAVINPGSSGGPLFNIYGQVVGINSAKIVMSGYEGLGFSIPINEAKAVIDDLIKYGYVTGRVSLGITGRTITSIGYEGFMIESINSDSSLTLTNVTTGDIITHVNGVRVTTYAQMRAELVSYSVGEQISLTILRLDRQTRQTQTFDINVTLQESK